MEITSFDKNSVKFIAEKSLETIREALSGSGLEIRSGGGTYDPGQGKYTMKIVFNTPLNVTMLTDFPSGGMNQDMVNCGMAPRGTRVLANGKPAIVHEARRAKYVVSFTHEPEKRWLVRFTACKLESTINNTPATV